MNKIYTLYIKTHNTTGLKYLGFTTVSDPHRYMGSGVYWNRHLKKHGKDVTTSILKECESHEEIKFWGKYYSDLWDIVSSDEWANEMPEQGDGIVNPTPEIKQKRRETRRRNKENGTVVGWTDESTSKCLETKTKNGTMNTRTPENIAKQLETRIARGSDPSSPKVIQKCRDTKLERGIVSNFITENPSHKKIECPHCSKVVTGSGAYSRWHGDNCKSKPT